MEWFSKNPPCPICGNLIFWPMPTKIEDRYLCDDCDAKIDIDEDMKSKLTLQAVQDYMTFYEQNQVLKGRFVVSQKIDFGFFGNKIIFDMVHRLFCVSGKPDKTVFEGNQLRSFTIKEDHHLLLEGSAQGLVRHTSLVPEQIAAFAQEAEQLQDDKDGALPNPNLSDPFHQFCIELHLDHPYRKVIQCDMTAPTFLSTHFDVHRYLEEYQRDVTVLEGLAKALMVVGFSAPEKEVEEADPLTAAPVTTSTADDLIQYRKLFDAGLLTQEEFKLKTKQLLGISL